MKRIVIIICVIALLFCACSSPNTNQESTPSVDEKKPVTVESLYENFIAQHDWNAGGNYAMYDMNGDAVPELIIKTPSELSVYWVKNGVVALWYSDSAYTSPLNDGSLLYVREGAAPKHTDYIYRILNYQGEVVFRVEFSEYEATEFQGVQYDKQYYINGSEVSQPAYDSLAGDLLRIKSDEIQWKALPDFM